MVRYIVWFCVRILNWATMQMIGESGGVGFLATEEVSGEFDVSWAEGTVLIRPKRARPQRRVVRPVARFQVETACSAYPEINISMGRIAF